MDCARTDYQVKGLLANRHVQSILASSKLRKRLKQSEHQSLLQNQTEVLLNAGDNDRLHCFFSKHISHLHKKQNPRKLVILIHGWEGSGDSTYLLSAASKLFNAGFSVLRFHLRDHGPSAHLNKGLFHAARLEEVLLAMQDIQNRFDFDQYFLVGFSLGGNFALRIGNEAEHYGLLFEHIVAISPVFSPADTMQALEDGPSIYRKYFIKKWKRALTNKQAYFPYQYDFSGISASVSLQEMTKKLVSDHTSFHKVEDYFNSYALKPSELENTTINTDVILAADDPVIPLSSTTDFSSSEKFRLRIFKNGGHCGFVQNWRFESWVDQELLMLFSK